MENLKKNLLIAAGTLCVVLGVIGMFIPVLPTTPFLLLAAVCYGRSSKRFYHWLLTNRWFGEYIRNYREGGDAIASKNSFHFAAVADHRLHGLVCNFGLVAQIDPAGYCLWCHDPFGAGQNF